MSAVRMDASAVAGTLARFRERQPRVHCITNAAAVNFTANVLLAAGAIPSMTINPEEIGGFVAGSDCLLVNLGTLDPIRLAAIDVALGAARETGKPWVLDPVFVERSMPRLAVAKRLAASSPAAIRANAAELAALTGADNSISTASELARRSGAVVVRTGEVDFVTDGSRSAHVAGGHVLMTRVTASGCASTALLAAFLAIEPDAVLAAAACFSYVAAAAEQAGGQAAGPGSFVPAFIDALYALSPDEVGASARIT